MKIFFSLFNKRLSSFRRLGTRQKIGIVTVYSILGSTAGKRFHIFLPLLRRDVLFFSGVTTPRFSHIYNPLSLSFKQILKTSVQHARLQVKSRYLLPPHFEVEIDTIFTEHLSDRL